MAHLHDTAAEQTRTSSMLSAQWADGGCVEMNENAAGIIRHAKNSMSAQVAAGGLDAALSSGDVSSFMLFLKEVVKARGGFTATARKTGLNRTALYKIVSPHG